MNTETNIQVVKDFFTAIGQGDKDRVLALVADEIEWIIPGQDWPTGGSMPRTSHSGRMVFDIVQPSPTADQGKR